MTHADDLVFRYGFSDAGARIATVAVADLPAGLAVESDAGVSS